MLTTEHRLIHGDARSMASVADASVEQVVTSPPYPMIEMWDGMFRKQNPQIGVALDDLDGAASFELMHRELDKVWRECFRVLKDGCFACINIGDATRTINRRFQIYSNHSRILAAGIAAGFDTLPLILWRKQTNAPNKFMGSGMLPGGAYVTLEHEYILLLRKGEKRTFDTVTDKKRRKESAYFWEERNRWFSDLWDFKGIRQELGDNNLRQRSAAFPFELPWRLVNMYSLRGETVLDPFAGTGTTSFAAMAAGRNSIGIEIDATFRLPFGTAGRTILPHLQHAVTQRVVDHIAFVKIHAAAKGAPKHLNRHYGFGVVTEQESDLLLLEPVKASVSADKTITVEYGPLVEIVDQQSLLE
jgi:DNA modification methylase